MPIDETSDEVLSSLRSILHSVHLPDKECLGDILLQLITSTIEVIRRMGDYIDGAWTCECREDSWIGSPPSKKI